MQITRVCERVCVSVYVCVGYINRRRMKKSAELFNIIIVRIRFVINFYFD